MRLVCRRIRDVLVGELCHIREVISSRCSGLAAKDIHFLDKQLALLVVFDYDLNLCIRCGVLHKRAVSQHRGGCPLAFFDLEFVGAGAGELDLTEVLGLVIVRSPGCRARQYDILSHGACILRSGTIVRVLGDRHREGYRYRNGQRTADVRHQLLHMRLVCNRGRFVLVREQGSEDKIFICCHIFSVLLYALDIQVTIVANFNDHCRGCGCRQKNL